MPRPLSRGDEVVEVNGATGAAMRPALDSARCASLRLRADLVEPGAASPAPGAKEALVVEGGQMSWHDRIQNVALTLCGQSYDYWEVRAQWTAARKAMPRREAYAHLLLHFHSTAEAIPEGGQQDAASDTVASAKVSRR